MLFRSMMLNKPAGVVSATSDDEHRTVMECILGGVDQASGRPPSYVAKDLFPMGRLDKDTEGLLILTNDGPLAHRLLSPAHHIPKTYYVELDAAVDESDVQSMRSGIDIGEKRPTRPAEMEILSEHSCFLTISEGKYHQIKRMFHAVGSEITFLKRESFGPLVLDPQLEQGKWRFLTDAEITALTALQNK